LKASTEGANAFIECAVRRRVGGHRPQVCVLDIRRGLRHPVTGRRGHENDSIRFTFVLLSNCLYMVVAKLDGSEKPQQLVHTRGECSALRWSPDASFLAFVSDRENHAFIGVYSFKSKTLSYPDASTDKDAEPVWSLDSHRLAFLRIPYSKDDLFFMPMVSNTVDWGSALFMPMRTGPPWSIRVIDVDTGRGGEIWKASEGRGSVYSAVTADNQLLWAAGNKIIFPWERDGWTHLYSVSSQGGTPILLTPGAFEVEDVSLTSDLQSVVYSSNQDDIDRRHIWRVPVTVGQPSALTGDTGIDDSDFYPFGAERPISLSSGNSYKFTGKERDSESGLDNFGARYNSSSMGRFMSPDPIYIEATKLADPQQLNLYSYVRNNPLNLVDPTAMLVDVNCRQVNATQCAQTVTDFNNGQNAQFQVTRDDETGQLNVASQNGDPSTWSDSERALYNAITDKSATGVLTVVGNDPSFDFEKYRGPGQNTVDRSDLNALNPADKRLSGEILAHAALESFQSATLAATEPNLSSAKIGQIAHDRARKAFGFALDAVGWQANTTGTLVTTPSLNFRATRRNLDFRVTTTLKTPIPLVTFDPLRTPGARDVTSVTILPPEK
jgi:RHS repeat-associated protein